MTFNVLPSDRANRLYIMLDQRSADFALVKTGITSDTLFNRMRKYKTANPLLTLVATCEVRKGKDLRKVESLFFNYYRKTRGYNHFVGEWIEMTSKKDIAAIRKNGFEFFTDLKGYIKKVTYYNMPVYQLWKSIER